jgi:hypothetical protein
LQVQFIFITRNAGDFAAGILVPIHPILSTSTR